MIPYPLRSMDHFCVERFLEWNTLYRKVLKALERKVIDVTVIPRIFHKDSLATKLDINHIWIFLIHSFQIIQQRGVLDMEHFIKIRLSYILNIESRTIHAIENPKKNLQSEPIRIRIQRCIFFTLWMTWKFGPVN